MSVPAASIQKIDYQTGSVAQSANPVGILAIIAGAGTGSSGNGPINTPLSYARDDLAFNDFGPSRLVEFASYTMRVSGNPAVLERATTSVAATYGAIAFTGTGTSVQTAGAAVPADNYDVLVKVVTGGTIGVAGIVLQASLDGGNSYGQAFALGTGTTVTIPNFPQGGSPGVSFGLTSTQTFVAGDYWRCLVNPARMGDTDMSAALATLAVSKSPWEGVLVDEDIGASTVGLLDAWLIGLEAKGMFRFGLLNTRMKNQLHVGNGTAETESAYTTAMTTLVNSSATTIRACVGTDGAALPSTLTGVTQPRPTSLLLGARAMAIPIGQDPAYVGAGPLASATFVDANGNPLFHNEEDYPNLDQLLLTALRSVNGGKPPYINNARVFSTVGSDYVFLQQIRTMNRFCEIAFAVMTAQLGKGIGKKPIDPTTGQVYILESDALVIEGLVNTAAEQPLKGQVNAFKYTLSRTDDLSNQSGSVLTASLAIVSLAYIKGFKALAAFARSIAVSG